MNKVTQIHLGGKAYQLEESGYELLSAYLKQASERLADNPDKDEIVGDFERAIAEKCNAYLGVHKNVVTTDEVQKIINEMGPVDGSQPEGTSPGTEKTDAANKRKRLYRIKEGALVGGVCMGIAEYFDIDVTFVRIGFVIFGIISFGAALIAYVIMLFIVPKADTNEKMAEARGAPFTAHEILETAKKNYAELKTDANGWKKYWKEHKHQWKHQAKTTARETRDTMRQWPATGAGRVGIHFANAIIGIVTAAITLAWVLMIFVVIKTGGFFGLIIPLGMPLWVAIVLLIALYNVILWPLRMARYPRWHTADSYAGDQGWFGIWEAVMWLGLMTVLGWVLFRHVPFVHRWLVMLGSWSDRHILYRLS